uniref:Uncharacterized protein n=1 Tax=Chromera velia CCMP2878 TaxID=1169474 RepID=A0A0G4GYH4_9ALVE|eukprot:Cvel_23913.t1-p1 / transcript=Cvel_23913.t1 / gene=Cvel_23913 / organism=Chromera_velia_CCMP2878 / gene_product=Disulfide-bond oxidoreductase YghU, putative / transcript_product=Disulfide-bond oxidoreductase YghU, putative / location=Cvel_scaffold2522:26347-26547(-) / protein_length=67 / sequence_SO=supercontig / SO=protein_coding / is_pseudo=false
MQIRCIDTGYGAVKFLDLPSYKNLNGWMDRVGSRPAVKRGLLVNSGSPGGIKERHSAKDFEQAEAAL